MSIEEIAAKMIPSDLDLWNQLVSEVEHDSHELRNILPSSRVDLFARTSGDSFRLRSVDVNLGVKREPARVIWNRGREFGPGVMPRYDSGALDIISGSYYWNRQQFPTIKDAALYLLGLLT